MWVKFSCLAVIRETRFKDMNQEGRPKNEFVGNVTCWLNFISRVFLFLSAIPSSWYIHFHWKAHTGADLSRQFYSEAILSRRGPLGKVWLAAHMERKLSKTQTLQTDIEESVGLCTQIIAIYCF
jgi:hypothetical protein